MKWLMNYIERRAIEKSLGKAFYSFRDHYPKDVENAFNDLESLLKNWYRKNETAVHGTIQAIEEGLKTLSKEVEKYNA